MMPIVPSPPAIQTAANAAPAQMRDFVWAINSETNAYDILNEFTPNNNQGNLLVIQSKSLITLNTFQGEWAAQPDFGIPFNTINENSDNPDVLSQVVVNEIFTVENVNNVSVQSFNYTATTRIFQATYNINTLFGSISVITG